ncbi:GntR family transcriptional regulator [Pseudomonas syringae]|uniref:GntR family transcriptional regulator n=1 Tax=Pseudomonas syringae pv. actinidifoliorum ICMP 18803 TaxID=1194400 RepID=A0AAT9SCS5_PSESX|nr:GntR family transcriptional regulator [Pseudomonas syringae]EPM48650.1 GntR family transcriptional regulator [Pseudomonas syringae pv. actinidiae ICMP 19098]EPN19348.1 GntR family transcriptional regulator [Pseudomonas syringae pv. actinidiae ICMP 19100]EPN27260.1 GntR family transcriptional regulator [Pseudomonas syringae pv. actinidiae ICMP 19099]EPN35196.1 GntR family transcriptional regulator [Pseudomonas syringae pv. actinidiae ICMP 18883]EPN43447.1 GntR family transcriptional regulato
MKNGKTALYEDLKRQILTMELDPDEALDEVVLCERYGLSRTPVREVFRRLAGEGYVDIRENRGTRVIPMNHQTLRNFFQVAPMMYAAIGRLAVHNYKHRQLVELKETQYRYCKAVEARDATAMVVENSRFHAIVGEMAGNQYLQPSLERLQIDHARIGHTFFRPRNEGMENDLQKSSRHHDLFIEALERRDEEAFVSLVFEHWEPSRKNMEIYIAPQGIKPDRFEDLPAQSFSE